MGARYVSPDQLPFIPGKEVLAIMAGIEGDVAYVANWFALKYPEANEEVIANARLIAAAPQLLEVCKELLDHLSLGSLEFAARYGDVVDPAEIADGVARRAIAAIAAAEGGAE